MVAKKCGVIQTGNRAAKIVPPCTAKITDLNAYSGGKNLHFCLIVEVNLKRFQKLLAATVYWVCQWGLDVVFN